MKIRIIILLVMLGLAFYTRSQTNQPIVPVNNGVQPNPIYPPNYTGSILINFARTIVPTMPVKTSIQLGDLILMNRAKEHTTYYDGFMRPLQEVSKKAVNVIGKDIVYHYNYDALGRITNDLLPFVKTDVSKAAESKFDKLVYSDLLATYNTLGYTNESYFYNETVYEQSALSRVIAQKGPGIDWNKSTGKVISERVANVNDDLLRFDISPATNSIPVCNIQGLNLGNILVTTLKDEDGNVYLIFKNELGKVIAEQKGTKRSYNVYDIFGRLRCLISPKAVTEIINNNYILTGQIIENLCFKYEYDTKGNIVTIKKPGIGPQFLKYDNDDRVVLSQDAIQRQSNLWLFTKYDVKGRVIQQGLYTEAGEITEAPNQGDILFGYNITQSASMPTFLSYLYDTKVYAINDYQNNFPNVQFYIYYYYDNYDYLVDLVNNNGYVASDLSFESVLGNATEGFIKEKGQNAYGELTGLYVRTNDNNKWLARANFYNKRGELIQTIAENLNGTFDITAFGYDFNSNLVKSVMQTSNTTIQKKYLYDMVGRIRYISHKIGAAADYRKIARYDYDEIGRLSVKYLGSMQHPVKYEYNIRNWITGINKQYTTNANGSQFFGMEINYNSGYQTNYLNGRISGIKWRTKGSSDELRSYGFLYDANQQLAKADYYYDSELQSPGILQWTKDEKDFTADRMNYDENGNILSMRHMGLDVTRNKIVLDDMDYSYEPISNKLLSVTESGSSQSTDPSVHDGLADFRDATGNNDYTYDLNGNLIMDNNRGIQINVSSWFTINKPIETSVLANSNNRVKYIYDATGTLLRKVVTSQQTVSSATFTVITDYIGDMVFENGLLKLINHDEGRIRVTQSAANVNVYNYDYYLKDHIQNIRCIIAESPEEGADGISAIDPSNFDPTIAPNLSSTTDAQPIGYIATSEVTNSAWEEQLFERVGETRTTRTGSVPEPDDYFAAELSAVSGLVLGPGKLIKVMAGDKIQLGAEAFFYSSTNPTNPLPIANIVSQLIGAITSAASLSGDVSQAFTQATLNGNQISLALNTIQEQGTDTTLPAAYLNYLVFNEAFHLLPDESGMLQVEQANAWQNMDVPQFEIHQNGYLYVFTSNQSQNLVSTDNLYIFHWQSRLLEEFNYYPFGLTFDVAIAPNISECNVKYNSQTLEQKEFTDANDQKYGINWYDFMARSYDMQIGRWMQPDPLMQHFSPYLAMANNPTSFTDPLGLFDGENPSGWSNRSGYPTRRTSTGVEMGEFNFIYSLKSNSYVGFESGNTYAWLNGGLFGSSSGSAITFDVEETHTQRTIHYSQSVLNYYRRIDMYRADKNAFEKVAQSGGGYDWGRAGNALTAGGIAYYSLEKSINNSKYWVDAKGGIRSTELLERGANGKYVRGVQGLRNSQAAAAKAASNYAVAGKVVGGLGMFVTGYQFLDGQISGTEASIDLIMGGIGFTGWGAPISLMYFGGKFVYEYSTGNTLFEKPGGR